MNEPSRQPSPLGLRVRDLRTAQRMSQLALADRAGVSLSTVTHLEVGLTKGVSVETLRRLSRALDVPMDVLAHHGNAGQPRRIQAARPRSAKRGRR